MRPRWLLPAGLALVAVVGCSQQPEEQVEAEPAASVAAAVHDLEGAVRSGDVEAARDLAPAGDAAAADLLAAVVENASAARLTEVSLRPLDDATRTDAVPAEEWQTTARVRWRVARSDPTPTTSEVVVALREDGDRMAVTGIDAGADGLPLWLAGPLQVRGTPSATVLVDATVPRSRSYARYAAAAAPVVRRLLPRWDGGLVVEVPASTDALEQTLGAKPGTYDRIAAVTAPAGARTGPGAPVHVFVNPDVLGRLAPSGARVVLAHEATHVATHAVTSTAPLWLVEGFADHVALLGSREPVHRAAADLLDRVRRDGAPRALPSDAAFGTGEAGLQATYQGAWLACRLVARAAGSAALVRLYRAVDAGRPLGAALRSETGMSRAVLIQRWRTLLQHLAR